MHRAKRCLVLIWLTTIVGSTTAGPLDDLDSYITLSAHGQSVPSPSLYLPGFTILFLDIYAKTTLPGIEGVRFQLASPAGWVLFGFEFADGSTVLSPSSLEFDIQFAHCVPVQGGVTLATFRFAYLGGPIAPTDAQLCLATAQLGHPASVRPMITPCGGEPQCIPVVNLDDVHRPLAAGCVGVNPSDQIGPILGLDPALGILDCSEIWVVGNEASTWGAMKARFR